jgi:hypothetical protein
MADRHDDHVGAGGDAGEIEAAQAAGRVEDDVADAGRRPEDASRVDGPADDGRGARQRMGGTLAQPALRRLLPVDVAEHDRVTPAGIEGREVGGQRALAAASLAIDDGDDGHAEPE